jgi:hypothetical protein
MVSRALYCVLVTLIVLAGSLLMFGQSLASEGKRVEVVQGVSVTIAAPWFLANRTRNAVEIAYPRSRERAQVVLSPGIKPETVNDLVTADARAVIQVEPWPNGVSPMMRVLLGTVPRTETILWLVSLSG